MLAAGAASAVSSAPVALGPGAEWGWAALDMASGRVTGEHRDLHLPMCSSFKWLLTACVLSRVDAGRERLDRRLAFGPGDIVFNSPVPEAALKAAGGQRAELTVGELCAATVTLSDSAAANLLFSTMGGPLALTAWLRAHGDATTRLDRTELALNRVPRGDLRDTTTPAAMLGDLRRILYGDVLGRSSRERLMGWMLGCQTGKDRLPAGLPKGWRIAHKTGTWTVEPGQAPPEERAASGDVGVLLPPSGAPILVAAYTAGSNRPQAEVERWFADLARMLTADAASRRTPHHG